MISDIKVKDIDILTDNEGKYVNQLQVMGIKNNLFNQLRFRKTIRIFNYNLIEFFKTDPKKCNSSYSSIKIPSNIDNISYKDMMSLVSINSNDKKVSELIIEFISTACYMVNELSLSEMKLVVFNMEFSEAMSTYNKISQALRDSQRVWEERFMSVDVPDQDYEAAGGQSMNQFNTVNTVINTCKDFNIPYEEAWKLSYSIIQTNSYSKATSAFIQHKMSEIKEAKMKAKRKNQI